MAKRIDIDVNLRDEKAKEDLQKLQNGKYNVNLNVNGSGTDKTTQKIQKLANEAKNTQSAFDKLKNTIGGVFSGKSLAFTAYLTAMNEIRKAANGAKAEIKDLDQSITDLSVAMGQGRSAASDYLKQLNQQAQSIGATTKEVADSADSWLRQGKSAKEAGELVYDSMMLSKLGQIQSADASKYLTSALNGYKKSASEAIDVVDKLTAVDMQSASDAGGLAESMSKTASAADMAGVSMDKLIGMIATVKEVTQDSDESVGNMFKSVFSRMNQIKAGKFVDSDTGESLNDTEKVLNKVGIAMRDTNNQFISSEKIMDEVGAKWSSFDSTTQRAVATAMAGTYQYNKLIALFNNYSKALDYTKTSAESAGTAVEKFNSSYKESLEAKTNSLQASFESMLMNSDMNKVYAGIIEATNALVKFIDKTGVLKGVLSGLAVGGAIKAFTIIRTATNESYINLNKFKNALDIVGKTRVSTNNFDRLLSLTSGLSMSQLKLVVSSKALTQAQRKQLLMAAGLSAEEAELQLKNWNLIRSNTGLTASTTSLKNAFSGLWTMMKANPIAVVTTVLTAGMAIWQKYKQSIEEAVSSASEASDTYKNQSQTIEEMVSKYQNLQKQLLDAKGDEEKTASVKEQLLELQQQLNGQFGDEYDKLNLVTDAYKDQTNAIKAYNKEAANTLLNDNRKGIEEATKQMTENKTYSLGTMDGLIDADELPIREKIKQIAKDNNIDFSHNGFEFTGNAEDAQKAINAFMNSLKELQKQSGNTSDTMSGIFDGLLDSSGEALSKANNITSKYKEIYQQAQLAEIATDDKLSSEYDIMTEAVEKYNNAISNSKNPYDDKDVESAYENLQKIKQEISDNSEWKKYKDIIDQTFDDADTKSYSFYIALKNNKNGVNDLANQLKGLTVTDVKSMIDDGNNGDVFDKINEKASKFGLSAEDVISILQQLGIIIENVESKTDTATTALVSFDEAWLNLKNTDDSDLKGAADDLLDLANAGQLTENALEGLAGGQQLMNETGLSAEELARKINGLVNASTQLSSMSTQISKMSDMLADKKNGTVASASDLAGFDVSVRGLESWDKFEEVMGSSESSMDQCQKAANALATEWVNDGNFLANLTDENKQYYITQLEDMGVKNAEQIVTEALTKKEEELRFEKLLSADASTDLQNATVADILKLKNLGDITEQEKEKLSAFTLEKQYCNKTTIVTDADCQNIYTLAKMAGAGTEALNKLAALKQRLSDNPIMSDEMRNNINNAVQDIVNGVTTSAGAKLDIPQVKVNPSGSSSYKPPKESKSKTKSDAAEVFDFIEIKLNNLTDKASKAKDKIDDLLTFGRKKNQTKKAIEATTKAITAQEKAYKKYMSYANKAAKKQNSKKTTSSSSSTGGDSLYDEATNYLGLKYVWGGASLTSGADCSGFTQQIYKKFGVSLPHHAADQAKMGTKITSKKNLQAGDLVFFGSKNNITHVGIYGGDGKFIESPHTGASVRVSKLSSRKDFVSGSRFSGISGSTTTTSSGSNVKKVKGVSSKTLEHYKSLIRNGTLDADGIQTIKNENLKNALKDYQTWYEKAKACKEQITSLKEQLKELYDTLANNPIDKAADKIEKLGTKMDLLNSKMGNLTFNPNKSINTSSITKLRNQITKNYDSQLSASKEEYTTIKSNFSSSKKTLTKKFNKSSAKKLGLTKSELSTVKKNLKDNKKIPNGVINKIYAKFGYCDLYERCIAHNEYLDAYRTATDDYRQAKEDHTSNVRQAKKDAFDKVQSVYDNKSNLIEQKNTAISNALSTAESRGQLIGQAYYTSQMTNTKADLSNRQKEADALAKKLKTIDFGSDEWYEAQDALAGVYQAIQQDEQELAEFQKSINELKFDRFDELINKLGDITDETDFLIDMLDSDNLFDSDTGMISQDGITAMGLTAQNYDTYLAKAQEYKKAIADLDEMYKNGEIGLDDYNSKHREYQQGIRDSIKSANDAKKATVDYVKQGLDAQNDALSEEIEKRKKLLEQEKSEKEFNDQTLERSKKIARLKRQIAILENDDSDSNRKNLRQLRSNLQDLEKEEKDSFYDKSISDQEEGLDKMLENSKKQAEDYLKDTNKVFSDALTYVNANSSQVASNIEKIAKDTGYDVSSYIVSAWKDGGNAVGDYASTLSSNVPNITAQLSLIESSWDRVCKAADKAAQASAKAASLPIADSQKNNSSSSSGSGNKTTTTRNNKTNNITQIQPYEVGISNWIKSKFKEGKREKSYYGALNQYLYDKSGGKVLSVADEVELAKKLKVSVKSDLSGKDDRKKILNALKTLVPHLSFNEGGILTDLVKLSGEDGIGFLKRGESVLSKEQTQAILNLAPVVPQINTIMDNLKNIPIGRTNVASEPHIEINTTIEGVATDQIVKDFENVATRQAENVIKKINQATYYTNGTRYR